jgi:ATP-dependent helicase/DNAse subunit B
MDKPKLIEPGMKYFLKESLKNCNKFRNNYNNYVINLILLFIFILVLGIFLFIRYRGKLTPLEKENKLNEQKTYILSKIRQLQDVKRQKSQELVTNLPKFDEYDYNNNNKYYV